MSGAQPSEEFSAFFPTFILSDNYPDFATRNVELLAAVHTVRRRDQAGNRESQEHYHGGYTSYFSGFDLMAYPEFRDLAGFITEKANSFGHFLSLDLQRSRLVMNHFWVNINPKYAQHPAHLHPHSLFSGVYYVKCSPESGDIVFKDPRVASAMLPPPYTERKPRNMDTLKLNPVEGRLLMFPAWLVHSVEQNLTDSERVSISYNFAIQANSRQPISA